MIVSDIAGRSPPGYSQVEATKRQCLARVRVSLQLLELVLDSGRVGFCTMHTMLAATLQVLLDQFFLYQTYCTVLWYRADWVSGLPRTFSVYYTVVHPTSIPVRVQVL